MTFKVGLLFLAFLSASCFSVRSQTTATLPQKPMALSGTIYDPFGAVVPGAVISASNKSAGVFRTSTDVEGSYRLNLLAGNYEIAITAPGFEKLVYKDLRIVNSTFGKMNFDLVIEGSTNHEPCGYGGDQCFDDEVPKDITTSPPLIETKIQTRPAPKKPAR